MRAPAIVDAFDGLVDRLFEPLRGRTASDRAAYVASELADYSVGWHLLNVVVALVRPDRELHAVRMAVTLGVESALVNGAIKPLFKRERPAGWRTSRHYRSAGPGPPASRVGTPARARWRPSC